MHATLRILCGALLLAGLLAGAAPPTALSGPDITCGASDLVLTVDITGSMGGAIANVRAELAKILATLDRASGHDYRVGLVTFSDTVFVEQELGPWDRETVTRKVEALTANGGGAAPEASDEAVRTIVNGLPSAGRRQRGDFAIDFRPDATKIIVLVTDAPAGGFDDRFVSGEDDANALARATEARDRGILISSVYVPTGGSAEQNKATIGAMKAYAQTTGGIYVQAAPNGSGTGKAIQNVISACGMETGFTGGVPMDLESYLSDLPWPTILSVMLFLVMSILLLAFLASVVLRNTGMHVANSWHRFLAAPFDVLCVALTDAKKALDQHIQEALDKWTVWATPDKINETDPDLRVRPGPWHGWELLNWLPHALILILVMSAHLPFAGLGATYILGLPLYTSSSEPFLFGQTLQAILFALAMLLPIIEFGVVILDIKGAGTGAARPFGNANANVRKAVFWASWIGIGLSLIGFVAFALFRAQLVGLSLSGGDGSGNALVALLPNLFIPTFELTVAGASALAFWAVFVGLGAVFILLLMALTRALGILRTVMHIIHEVIEAWDVAVISVWDFMCKPFTYLYNWLLADRVFKGRRFPRIIYCKRCPVAPRCRTRESGVGVIAEDFPCYCTPSPQAAPNTADRGAEKEQTYRRSASIALSEESPTGVGLDQALTLGGLPDEGEGTDGKVKAGEGLESLGDCPGCWRGEGTDGKVRVGDVPQA